MVNFRAEAGKSGEGQRETEEGENLEYSLLKVSRIHLRSIQKRILAYFVTRVCGHPCPWSLLGPERQIRPAGSPGRGVSPTGLASSQSCSPRPTREASSGSVKTRAPHLPRPLAPSPGSEGSTCLRFESTHFSLGRRICFP